ncbi:MAG: hypothetical protein B1H08_03550 [Candidatus Omnitrophica bacterium 4484_171]|nr:MAG: hypothetical protein B1H08_03550 [Candidatus Omnitrophica bacterium 4484_171]
MRKVIYVVLDGIGDLPVGEFGGKTPLEAAYTVNMDLIAKKGIQGFIYPVGRGIAPESDIAVISLLGYDAGEIYTGRGPIESYAEGLDAAGGDLALRVNFAAAEAGSSKIIDRRAGGNLAAQEAEELAREINQKVKLNNGGFIFKNTIGHRGVLVIKSSGSLSGRITNTDPAYDRKGVFSIAKETFKPYICEAKPMSGYENDERAVLAARLINEFTVKSRNILEESIVNKKRVSGGNLPANLILSRDAGDRLPEFKPIREMTGLNFGCFVQMPVEKGIALLCGMNIVDAPLPSNDLEREYKIWAKMAIENIRKFDALYIHIKGPDEPGHDGDCRKKKEIIELIDKYFFGSLLPRISDDVIIAITGDHSTPCSLGAHSADPVVVAIYGAESDDTSSFGEKEASKGKLGYFLGKELIYKLVELSRM